MAGVKERLIRWGVVFILLVEFLPLCQAGIHHLSIKDDSRSLIIIEGFGFSRRGQLEITVTDASWSETGEVADEALTRIGFFLATEEDWLQLMREMDEQSTSCPLESHYHTLFTFSHLNASKQYSGTFSPPGANHYVLIFANCLSPIQVSMSLRTSMYNLEGTSDVKDYLSVGQTQLPVLYFSFFLLYLVLGGMWIYICVKQKVTTHRIHILMGILLVLKAFYLFSEVEDKAYIKRTGTPHGWDIAFYAFSFLRGVMLFTVIILIGTGWSFLKPYLQGREKRVLMIVIPLQVLENVATVVIGETGPFWKNWLTWSQLLLVVDVICCCAILFPIVWSIKHLRQAAHTDGKAARNLVKLTLFRQYYIVVVGYIYYTRIIVLALKTVASYQYWWVGELNSELATLAFYIFTGYKFRPVPHNPYFVLDDDEEETGGEEAFKDDDFEL
eukprot:c23519_g1_i2 orf=331-1659(+)